MNRFKRYYMASTTMLIVILTLSTLSSLFSGDFQTGMVIAIVFIAAMLLFPVLLSGGIERHRRFAIGMSVLLAAGFATMQGFVFVEFVRTKGLEGPNGEGAPGAVIIAMVFFAVLFLCPWLLTALRGIRLWNTPIQEAEQAVDGNPH